MTQLGGHAQYLAPGQIQLGGHETIEDTGRVLSDPRGRPHGPRRPAPDRRRPRTLRLRPGAQRDVRLQPPHPGDRRPDHHGGAPAGGQAPGGLQGGLRRGRHPGLRLPDDDHHQDGHGLRPLRAQGFQLSEHFQAIGDRNCAESGGSLLVTDDPDTALAGADFVYSDVWYGLYEAELSEEERLAAFMPKYQVNADLMAKAAPGAKFMHCLPPAVARK